METKAFIKNRVPAAGKPCAPITAMIPETFPDLSLLRVFGCSASLSLPKVKRGGKLNPVSVSGVFVGYSSHTKGWRVAVGNKVHESPSVVFREEMSGDCSVVPAEYPTDSESDDESVVDVATGAHMHDVAPPPVVALQASPVASPGSASEAGDTDIESVRGELQAVPQAVLRVETAPGPRRGVRVRSEPARLLDEQVLLAEGTTDFDEQEPYDVQGYVYAVGADAAPKSYADIANFGDLSSLWYESYQHELDNMYGMKVLSTINAADVPPGESILDSKLDFRNKYSPSGDMAERKTRLCARGDQQQAGFFVPRHLVASVERATPPRQNARITPRRYYHPCVCYAQCIQCATNVQHAVPSLTHSIASPAVRCTPWAAWTRPASMSSAALHFISLGSLWYCITPR